MHLWDIWDDSGLIHPHHSGPMEQAGGYYPPFLVYETSVLVRLYEACKNLVSAVGLEPTFSDPITNSGLEDHLVYTDIWCPQRDSNPQPRV